MRNRLFPDRSQNLPRLGSPGALLGTVVALVTKPDVRVRDKPDLETLPRVVAAREAVDAALEESGRLVLRYSGTEPLVRIMIEGRDRAEIERLAEELAAVLAEELG